MLDGWVRMRQVQQHGQGEVPACGVAAEDDGGWGAAGVDEDVAQGVDGLAQLGRVDGVRGEGVVDEEEGDVVVRGVQGVEEGGVEFEVVFCGWDDEAAACDYIVLIWLVHLGTEEGRRETWIVDDYVLRILVPHPMRRCAVDERHAVGLQASGFHEAFVHGLGRGVRISSHVCQSRH